MGNFAENLDLSKLVLPPDSLCQLLQNKVYDSITMLCIV